MVSITNEEKIKVELTPKTKAGKPARVDGVPPWTTSDPAVATVEDIAADGLSGWIVSQGPGVCQVTIDADADLGAGVRDLPALISVEVKEAEAETMDTVVGTPVLK